MVVGNIGVVGVGVVGQALGRSFSSALKQLGGTLHFYDKYKKEYNDAEVFHSCQLSFVCVSVPTLEDGSQDLSNIYEVFERFSNQRFNGVVVLKSTVLPGTTQILQEQYPNLKIVHSPEFLRQASALSDIMEEKILLLSGAKENCQLVMDFYSLWKKNLEFQQSDDYHVTEYAKYIHNCFLATKVVWMHELKKIVGEPFDQAVLLAAAVGAIGPTHNMAPGQDGFGYAGACFPKDMLAFSSFLKTHTLLSQAVETNRQLRSNR